MVLANSCARLTIRVSGRLPLNHTRTRFLSFQCSRPLPKISPYGLSNTRNYWWSKTPAPEPSNPVVTSSPEHPLVPQASSSVPETPSLPASDDAVNSAQSASNTPEASAALAVPTAQIPEPPVPDVSSIPTASDVIPPLNYGDFAELGIAGWTPAGIIRWSFELLQVSTGMPWFYAIIAGTLLWRVALVPVSVASIRNSARLLPFTSQLMTLGEETKNVPKGDRLAMQRILLKRQKIYEQAGVRVGPSMFLPFIQIPVTFGMFLGVKKMVQLPVEQLKQSGIDILPDLTMADPYFILPIITTVMVNIQMTVMRKDMNIAERPEMAHFMNFMRILSVTGLPFMGHLPSGLWLSVVTGVTATALQSLILQQPAVRHALKIPPLVKQAMPFPTMIQSLRFAQTWWQNRSKVTATKARR